MNNVRPKMYPCSNPNLKFKKWNQKDYQQHDKVYSVNFIALYIFLQIIHSLEMILQT